MDLMISHISIIKEMFKVEIKLLYISNILKMLDFVLNKKGKYIELISIKSNTSNFPLVKLILFFFTSFPTKFWSIYIYIYL